MIAKPLSLTERVRMSIVSYARIQAERGFTYSQLQKALAHEFPEHHDYSFVGPRNRELVKAGIIVKTTGKREGQGIWKHTDFATPEETVYPAPPNVNRVIAKLFRDLPQPAKRRMFASLVKQAGKAVLSTEDLVPYFSGGRRPWP